MQNTDQEMSFSHQTTGFSLDKVMKKRSRWFVICMALAIIVIPFSMAQADGNWYVGGSVGQAYLELDVEEEQGDVFAFDEEETAWKLYGGYVWNFPLINLGIEGGYVNLASPVAYFSELKAELEPSGINLWGVASYDIGPVGLFGKLGGIAWEIDGKTFGPKSQSFDESGTDFAYGMGAKVMLWSIEFRVEIEKYDIKGTKNVDMFSAGVARIF